jgi:hypothetical protein
MIHPSDFDDAPPVDAPDASSANSKSTRVWALLCFVFIAVSVVTTAMWRGAVDAATTESDRLNATVAGLIQERDGLRLALSDLEANARAAARDIRVSVTQLRLASVLNGVAGESLDPADFLGSELRTLQFVVQGGHPLCGKEEFSQPITVIILAPDATVFRHALSPEDATSVLPAACQRGETQWSVSQSLGYDAPGMFALGNWRVMVLDRGTVVARREFSVR